MSNTTMSNEDGGLLRRPIRPVLNLVLECARPLAGSLRIDLTGLDSVVIGRGEERGRSRPGGGGPRDLRIAVPDGWMSSVDARLSKDRGMCDCAGRQLRNGTLLNNAPAARQPLSGGDVLEVGHTFFLFRMIEAPADAALDLEATPSDPGGQTLSWDLHEHMDRLTAVARSEVPILVNGESGTGKELIARAVHRLSGRRGPFVPVNCGALPANLLEAELFGSRKGSFTGATEDRPGLIRSADGGTLFLDELGDLPSRGPARISPRPSGARGDSGRRDPPEAGGLPPRGGDAPRSVPRLVAAGTFRQICWPESPAST